MTAESPRMNEPEARMHATFQALMWALSYPGRVHILPTGGRYAFAAIAETLIDLETSFFTTDQELQARLARTGARSLPADQARYHFYPQLRPDDLPRLREAPRGSYTYPDESATLVIGCGMQAGRRLRLRGPGIAESMLLEIAHVPDEFWHIREETRQYPLGWDVFFVAGDWIVGLPRTSTTEVF